MEIFGEILKKIFTKEDLLTVLDEINLTREFLFKNKEEPLSKRIKGKVRECFCNFIEDLEKRKILTNDSEKDEIFFLKLKNFLLIAPQMLLEISFEPSQEFLEKISFFLERETGEKIILDIYINPEIIGGARIEFKGKYGDFSLINAINKTFKK